MMATSGQRGLEGNFRSVISTVDSRTRDGEFWIAKPTLSAVKCM